MGVYESALRKKPTDNGLGNAGLGMAEPTRLHNRLQQFFATVIRDTVNLYPRYEVCTESVDYVPPKKKKYKVVDVGIYDRSEEDFNVFAIEICFGPDKLEKDAEKLTEIFRNGYLKEAFIFDYSSNEMFKLTQGELIKDTKSTYLGIDFAKYIEEFFENESEKNRLINQI